MQTDSSRAWRGRRVVVTGGSAGLGLALSRALAARGAKVGIVARDAARVAEVERASEGAIAGVAGDVSDKDAIHRIAMELVARLGGVDVLVHNASSLGPVPLRPLADTECEDLERALATNVLGPHRLTRALLGPLASAAREERGALVLSVSSDAAINAYAGWGAYGASKAALAHATRIWDAEMRAAHGVAFLSIDPGDMDTELHELALPGSDRSQLKRPEDAARELIGVMERELASLGRAS